MASSSRLPSPAAPLVELCVCSSVRVICPPKPWACSKETPRDRVVDEHRRTDEQPGDRQAGFWDCWPSSPGQVPVSLSVASAAPRSKAALTTANIAPCSVAASKISPPALLLVGGLRCVISPADD